MIRSIIEEFNSTKYDIHHTAATVTELGWVPPLSIAIYLVLIYVGRRWMETKSAYSLRAPLFIWNLSLAVFSMLGMIVMLPPLCRTILEHGFEYSVCFTTVHTVPLQSFFSMLFVFSKVVEFGDTFFVVLRKTPLNFLHWYHHVTVCFFSWYSLAIASGPAHWYCAMNYLVHSVMYSYYVIKSTGLIRIPKIVPLLVTGLQLLQFMLGFIVTYVATSVFILQARFCHVDHVSIAMGLSIYFSYFLLFANFFYHRYLKKPDRAKTQ